MRTRTRMRPARLDRARVPPLRSHYIWICFGAHEPQWSHKRCARTAWQGRMMKSLNSVWEMVFNLHVCIALLGLCRNCICNSGLTFVAVKLQRIAHEICDYCVRECWCVLLLVGILKESCNSTYVVFFVFGCCKHARMNSNNRMCKILCVFMCTAADTTKHTHEIRVYMCIVLYAGHLLACSTIHKSMRATRVNTVCNEFTVSLNINILCK